MSGCGCGCGLTEAHQLVRDGTGQHQRALPALDPSHVPVDERRPEHHMVFAAGFAQHLRFHDLHGTHVDSWQPFFASDVSVQLAVAATEDVTAYRQLLKTLQRELADPVLPASDTAMQAALGAVFDVLGTVARRLDELAVHLPPEQPLRATLGNLIAGRLSPVLRRLIGYHVAGVALGVLTGTSSVPPSTRILGKAVEPFATLLDDGLEAPEWGDGADVSGWTAYAAVDAAHHEGAWGTSGSVVERANHLATHNLFTAICDTFLAVLARVTDEARGALGTTLEWSGHQPHFALLLSFLRLLEHARRQTNQLTANHLDFYYRRVLGMAPRPAEPAHAHLLVELAKHTEAHLLEAGTLARAGKDGEGADAHVALGADLAATRAAVTDIRRLHRHVESSPGADLPLHDGRLFASGVEGETWHPFAERVHTDGALTAIAMPPARVGFAVASHVLRLAGGQRTITLAVTATGSVPTGLSDVDLLCRLTTADGWLDKHVTSLDVEGQEIRLQVTLDGNDPAITGYDPGVHEHRFDTTQPVLLVLLQHDDQPWDYPKLAGLHAAQLEVEVDVKGLRPPAVSTDHGTVDTSKPFLAFGAAPAKSSSLVIGAREALGKPLEELTLHLTYQNQPVASGASLPTLSLQYLNDGRWQPPDGTLAGPFDLPGPADALALSYPVTAAQLQDLEQPRPAVPAPAPDEPLTAASTAGFVRLVLDGGFGTDTYPVALAKFLTGDDTEPAAPVLPTVVDLTLDYGARQVVALDTPSEADGHLFHITAFGHTTATGPSGVPLLPQFRVGADDTQGELYLGVRDLRPPATLSLLFQVADGTANPLVVKPDEHLQWAWLHGNDWEPFPADAVGDATAGLLASGIVTLAVPADADLAHTLLPDGLHWIRVAVASRTDAVSRLRLVAAQAVRATSARREDGSYAHTGDLPAGTVTKLDPPQAAVKAVTQPHAMFGGRPDETEESFSTRVSERLRHKDRAIALWDYERLVLEAFPDLYQVRCLNHTRYEPTEAGTGSYSELAPGHVTVVTIPDLRRPNPLDPLRPATSLRLLSQVEQFLVGRMSCFATLHVRNPQFEEVRVDLRARFRGGADETLTRKRLQDEITAFLSPWAFRDERPSFNGVVRKSVLVDFVEERPYVDFVTDVKLFHRLPGTPEGVDGPDLTQVVGSRAVSILVSVPSHRHTVHPIHATEEAVRGCGCGEVPA